MYLIEVMHNSGPDQSLESCVPEVGECDHGNQPLINLEEINVFA